MPATNPFEKEGRILRTLYNSFHNQLSCNFCWYDDASAISCEIRGVSAQDLKDSNARKVFPKTLLNLSLEADRTFVY